MDGSEETSGDGPQRDGPDDRPVSTLRGAGVQIDTARAARIALVLCLATLVVVGSVLLIAGYRRNAQIDDLRAHGAPVQVSVTHCLGLMGGTGSSPAGYECTGSYTFHGAHYAEGIPGSTFYPDGAVVAGVVSTGDPGLLSTPSTVARAHTSVTLYLLGALLFVTAAAIGVWSEVRRRRGRSAA
jgi:hypothetical protein